MRVRGPLALAGMIGAALLVTGLWPWLSGQPSQGAPSASVSRSGDPQRAAPRRVKRSYRFGPQEPLVAWQAGAGEGADEAASRADSERRAGRIRRVGRRTDSERAGWPTSRGVAPPAVPDANLPAGSWPPASVADLDRQASEPEEGGAKGPTERLDRVTERAEFEEPEDDVVPELGETDLQLYASLRLRVRGDRDETSLSMDSSRIGINARALLGTQARTFGRIEIQTQPGDDEELLRVRLGYFGADTGLGRVSYGKQWSPYYDVAVMTDQLPALDGRASGTFNVGDGTVSGTGRAAHALQLRGPVGPIDLALQTQMRGGAADEDPLFDTVSASVSYAGDSVKVGGAFSVVRDGVPEPSDTEPAEDDAAYILGARYRDAGWTVAGTLAWLENHERDDRGRIFTGRGLELYLSYDVSDRLQLRATFEDLSPDDDYVYDYRLRAGLIAARYRVPALDAIDIALHAIHRFDAGRRADGSARSDVTVFQANLNF